MANHHSCIRRLRQTKARTLHNRYYAKTMRNAVRKLRAMENKEEAEKLLPTVQAMLDKLQRPTLFIRIRLLTLLPVWHFMFVSWLSPIRA